MKFLKLSLILTAFALFVFACSNTANNSGNNAANNTKNTATVNTQTTPKADENALGKTSYKQNCANCHKDDGTGGKVTIEGKTMNPDNLTSDKMKQMADEKYVKYIENGIPDEGMPAFKGRMTDAEIKATIAYIRKEFQGK
ncbi:MAG TPA: cytochrome c [Pyrinomonadaceae bacterium]|nr:cytochrome c [Pyrinomonadaceae bacterium]